MRARYYNPQIQLFIDVDPVSDGFNWYSYTDGNPINRVDYSGYSWKDSIIGIISSIDDNVFFGIPQKLADYSYTNDYELNASNEEKNDFYWGRVFGDAASFAAGGVAMVGGMNMILGGLGLTGGASVGMVATGGLGSPVFAPAASTGIAIVGAGASVAAAGAGISISAIESSGNNFDKINQIKANLNNNGGSLSGIEKAKEIAKKIKNNNMTPPKDYRGGRTYYNNPRFGGQKLPEGVNYREYDINPYTKGVNRGPERIVIGDDGSVWYTSDHYQTFIRIE